MAEMMLTLSFGAHSVSTDIEVPEAIGNANASFEEFREAAREKLESALTCLQNLSNIVTFEDLDNTKEF
ncbi:hypothetical protein GMA3_45 [Gordonia phage GMA3]|uniref:Uncharacterized protein n=1 Tax=Gordonia phage GMA3 TaxID=1647284 RepID=A0A0K0NL00_9CAUD|nr:hypothetical protein AU105_gp045 [Gordonia phage GMA3]AKL88222.1 hypothetical protein GMA3_45 [Gordonia phage GMA3]